jgi:hypothetical protein
MRRRRAKIAEVKATLSALHTGAICPIDGRVFAISMFSRRRGRPRKYDCDVCREIAKQMRANEDENEEG